MAISLGLSDRTHKVLSIAHWEAWSNGLCEVDASHLVVAIIKEGTGEGSKLLCQIGADIDTVRCLFHFLTKPRLQHSLPKMPRSEKVDRIIDLASPMAISLGDKEVCPIHLLLVMVKTNITALLQVLAHCHQDPEEFAATLTANYQQKKLAKSALALWTALQNVSHQYVGWATETMPPHKLLPR